MKLTRNTKRANGMTLLELTVVILVLLSLISILFVGARAWKKGSDRSANIMNVRNVQQAARGYENMNQLSVGAAIPSATVLFGDDGYLKAPTPPAGGEAAAYTYSDVVGAPGDIFVTNAATACGDGTYWYTAAEEAAKTSDW